MQWNIQREREALGDGAESFELVYNLATKRLLIEFVRGSVRLAAIALASLRAILRMAALFSALPSYAIRAREEPVRRQRDSLRLTEVSQADSLQKAN